MLRGGPFRMFRGASAAWCGGIGPWARCVSSSDGQWGRTDAEGPNRAHGLHGQDLLTSYGRYLVSLSPHTPILMHLIVVRCLHSILVAENSGYKVDVQSGCSRGSLAISCGPDPHDLRIPPAV